MISVIICTRDREADLARVLESLQAQETGRDWEVLVVDNGSTDGTADVARRFAGDFPTELVYTFEETPGLSHGRNRGLREARGDVVFFLDDDVTLPREWVECSARAYDDPDVVGSGGRVIPSLPEDTPSWLVEGLGRQQGGPTSRFDWGDERIELESGGKHGLPVGANMGVRRQRALDVGGFRTDIGWGKRMLPGEETEFFSRVAAGTGRLLYLPDAWVHHHIQASRLVPAYLRRWNMGYGRASMVMSKRPWLARAAKAVGQLGTLVRFCPVLLRREGPFDLRAHRKFYQAIGRLAEFSGL